MIVLERPWCWRPGFFRSRVCTRVWWGLLAVKVIHVSEYDYATKEWAWLKR